MLTNLWVQAEGKDFPTFEFWASLIHSSKTKLCQRTGGNCRKRRRLAICAEYAESVIFQSTNRSAFVRHTGQVYLIQFRLNVYTHINSQCFNKHGVFCVCSIFHFVVVFQVLFACMSTLKKYWSRCCPRMHFPSAWKNRSPVPCTLRVLIWNEYPKRSHSYDVFVCVYTLHRITSF